MLIFSLKEAKMANKQYYTDGESIIKAIENHKGDVRVGLSLHIPHSGGYLYYVSVRKEELLRLAKQSPAEPSEHIECLADAMVAYTENGLLHIHG
jgi:hypothetical protein